MKVELTVGPAPAMILKALRVEGRPWQGEDKLGRCVGRPAEKWLSPSNGRFYVWRGIAQELCSALNTRILELTIYGGDWPALWESLRSQEKGISLDLRWVRGPAGESIRDCLTELKNQARAHWLRRSLERLEHMTVSPWRFRLISDPDGLQNRLLIPALAEHQCRVGEQPLFRLALAGRKVAADFLQAEAEIEGPPLVICAPMEAAKDLVRRLPSGTEIFAAEDGASLLAELETMAQDCLPARALAASLAELSEDAGDPEDWMDAGGPVALELLRQSLQALGEGRNPASQAVDRP